MTGHPDENKRQSSSVSGAAADAAGPSEPQRTIEDLAVVSMGIEDAAVALTRLARDIDTKADRSAALAGLRGALQANVALMGEQFEHLAAAVMRFSLAYEDLVSRAGGD